MDIEVKTQKTDSKEENKDFIRRKKDVLPTFFENKDIQKNVEEVLNSIVISEQFTEQQIQDYLPKIINNTDTALLIIPSIIKTKLGILIDEGIQQTKIETTQTEIETTQTEMEINERYNQIVSDLLLLQKVYPQHQVNQEYITTNTYIFDGTPFQSSEEKNTILTYKYILEQIVAEKTENQQPITAYEHALITNFNTFCFDTGIQSQIELPKTENISSVRDLINDDNLGQTLYQKNTNIKSFIDQQKPIELTTKDLPLMQHITELYPDAISQDIQELFADNKIDMPQNFSLQELVKNNTIHIDYLQDNNLTDFLPTIQTILEKYNQQAQQELQNRSTKAIHQHTFGTCLQTIASYFDTVTLNMEDFAGDMKLNENNIQIQNNTVIIQGTIHEKSITISYDLQTGIIQSQDFILANTGVVYIGDTSKQQESLNFHGPTYDEIQERSTAYTTQSLANHVRGDFEAIDLSLRNGLRHKVPVKLDAVLGRDVMEHTIEKNIATKQIQNLLSLGLPTGQARSKGINPEIRQLYTIFDKSMDRYTPAELRRLRGLLTQLDTIIRPIIQNTIQTQRQGQDPLWVFLFNQEKLQEDSRNRSDHNSFFKFFSTLTYNKQDYYLEDVLNLHLIEKVINAYKKPQEEGDKIAEMQPLYEWYEESEKNADNILKELYT